MKEEIGMVLAVLGRVVCLFRVLMVVKLGPVDLNSRARLVAVGIDPCTLDLFRALILGLVFVNSVIPGHQHQPLSWRLSQMPPHQVACWMPKCFIHSCAQSPITCVNHTQ